MTVNHDPDGVVGFHNDGSPVHSRLQLTFQEIQYVTSSDTISDYMKKEITDIETRDRQSAPVTGTTLPGR